MRLMTSALIAATTVVALAVIRVGAQTEPPAGEPEAYYTEAQAERGTALFEKHCGACHFAELDPAKAKLETRGFVIAEQKLISNLGGDYIVAKKDNGRRIFTNVYYVYREIESMPAIPDSIDPLIRVDILAYLLKQNGFPAGRAALRFDLGAMKLMPLDERGFVRIFNGRDFTGWKFLVGLGCAPPPQGCGTTQPGTSFVIRSGVMHGSGKAHGFAYTDRKYRNFTLRLDYLAERPADWDSDDIYFYANTGYHLFLMDENLFVWPKSITLAGEQRDVLKPVALGGVTIKAQTWDNDARLRVVRPLGEWNSIEIVSKDGDIKAYLNDTLISTVTQHEFTQPGHIGLQMQGFAARWRNIRIRED
jgi:mono/diheme cytochrome c family protein